MNSSGAIFLYDDANDRLDTFIDDGRLDVPDNILVPQLEPKATCAGYSVMEFRWTGTEQVGAVCLWGTNQLIFSQLPILTVERWSGSSWVEVAFELYVGEATQFSPTHLVAVFDEEVETTRMRVTPFASSSSISIGYIQFAKVVQGLDTVDAGYGVTPFTTSVLQPTKSGQIVPQRGSQYRRIRINHRTLNPTLMHGYPSGEERVQLPAATIAFGRWSGSGSGPFTMPSGEDQDVVTFSGALESGANYLLEYRCRIEGQGSSINPPTLNFNFSLQAGHGRRFVHFTASSTDLEIVGGTLASPSSLEIEILGLYKVNESPAEVRRTMTEVIGIAATGLPIGLIIRPSRPTRAGVSTVFGFVESFQEYTDLDGEMKAGGLTIAEAL